MKAQGVLNAKLLEIQNMDATPGDKYTFAQTERSSSPQARQNNLISPE